MLQRLHLKNFTVFADADFEFVQGLNVLVGTNGTGKSHVLKVGYAGLRAASDARPDSSLNFPEVYWADLLERILNKVFLPESLRDLIRHTKLEESTVLRIDWENGGQYVAAFEIPNYPGIEKGSMDDLVPIATPMKNTEPYAAPVFIPAKEVLSIFYGFLALYENREVDYDLTYPDLCRYLSLPNLRKAKYESILVELENIMGGTVRLNGQRFVFESINKRYPLSINLYAEGLRKFGALWQLLRNGSLNQKSSLFWDEPESNLNPALLRKLAAILAELARQGFQIILATHSTDLLKEFHILSRQKNAPPLPIKYFGLNAEPGEATRIVSTDNFEFLPDVVALAEELKQADELEEIFIREDREHYANNRGEEPGV